ncbi:unnamed protein product, partial [Strongylus vulgaris]
MTGPDEEEPVLDVKPQQFDKEGSVTTEDGFTDASSVSVASPSTSGHRHRPGAFRRCLPAKKEAGRKGQYIAQTLRELSPEVSSMKILEITKVLHTPMSSTSNASPKPSSSKTPQTA